MRADIQPGPLEHDELERSLLLAGVLLGMRSHVLESLGDPFSSYEGSHAALVQFLSERSLVAFGVGVAQGDHDVMGEAAIHVVLVFGHR